MAEATASTAPPEVLVALPEAVARIRLAQPGLVAKQVHAELFKEDVKFAVVSISEVPPHLLSRRAPALADVACLTQVKRLCSKLAKAEVAEQCGGPTWPQQFMQPAHGSSQEKDPPPRDATQFKVSRPGMSMQGTTLQRGDRLGTAAERGDTQQVLKLLKKGVDPNFQNAASGVTPLGVACERGHTGVVRALLDARADVEIPTAEGYRALHIATQFGQKEIVELLVRRGKADVNARCPLQDAFPLLLAVNFNFLVRPAGMGPCAHRITACA
jgi:hypothetical protein